MFTQGTKGTDSASELDYGLSVETGAHFTIRYSAGAATDPGNPSYSKNAGKLLKPGELEIILSAGSDFLANDEWYETRISEGASAAEQDAPVTLAFWQVAGLHPGSTIMLNWDTSPTSDAGTLNNIAAYIARTNQIWGGEYLANGLYGGIPMLNWAAQNTGVVHGWIPEASSWSVAEQSLESLGISAPPAVTNWDLWEPLPSQFAPSYTYLGNLCVSLLESVIWQDKNKWFSGAADENAILRAGTIGSHLEAGGQPVPTPPAPPAPPAPAPVKYGQGSAVPSFIAQGTHQYLGSISGPAASHGGYYPAERPSVQLLQRRLIACGFVPGITNPLSGWADGIFDTPADHPGTGATSQAMTRFQRAHMPQTIYYGQCWWDDWTKLFSL